MIRSPSLRLSVPAKPERTTVVSVVELTL